MDAYAFALAPALLGGLRPCSASIRATLPDGLATAALVTRRLGTGRGRLNVSAAYSNSVISREPGGAA